MNPIAQRTLPKLLEDAHAAAERLSLSSRSWSTFMPNRAALEEAANVVEGLRRTICELQPHAEQLNHRAARDAARTRFDN